jgi:alpha-tubulin suppressor-like RCC1 family protein
MPSKSRRLSAVFLVAAALAMPVSLTTPAGARPAPASLSWDGPVTLSPIAPGSSASYTATLTNIGGSTARSVAVSIATGSFSITSNSCSGVSLRAGRSCQVSVLFSPTGSGSFTGELTATSRTATTRTLSTNASVASALSGAVAINSGSGQTCVITSAGAAKCWGSNWAGQIGDGTTSNAPVARQVTGLTSGVTAISAGGQFTCAIHNEAAKCWGSNWAGQLGNGTNQDNSTPQQVTGLSSGVTAIGTGDDHACAIQATALYCWGLNGSYELGNNTQQDSSTPVAVPGMGSGVTLLAVGGHHTCAVKDGTLYCWGRNGDGQIGNGATDPDTRGNDVPTPTPVVGIGTVTDVWLGVPFSCALRLDDSVWCWGSNGSGQLGDAQNAGSNSWVPVQVTGLTAGVVDSITASNDHACALIPVVGLTGNEARCWGYNGDGQLGVGDDSDRNIPVQVSGLASGVSIISAGWMHTCAIMTDTQVKCWGAGGDYQLGNGSNSSSSTPVTVLG